MTRTNHLTDQPDDRAAHNHGLCPPRVEAGWLRAKGRDRGSTSERKQHAETRNQTAVTNTRSKRGVAAWNDTLKRKIKELSRTHEANIDNEISKSWLGHTKQTRSCSIKSTRWNTNSITFGRTVPTTIYPACKCPGLCAGCAAYIKQGTQ